MKKWLIGGAALAMTAFALAACDRDTAQQADREGAQIGRETNQALATAKDKLTQAGHELAQAGRKTEQTVDNAVNDASAKGRNGNVASAAGSRFDDAAITASIEADFLKDPDLSVLKIDVDTHDGVVTLNGLAENDAARQRAERIAGSIKGVKTVRNYLVVKKV